MIRNRVSLVTGLATIGLLAFSTIATGQATRTWVSGVGDDVNPCSRTAPCKTFAGAISKTAMKGEINVIDAGGFGAVTITKSITIDGLGALAGVLVAGTNGIVVNITPSANDPDPKVILRNLDINGIGTGLKGIRFIGTGSLDVEDVHIYGFTQQAIDFSPTGVSDLKVVRVSARENGGAGVLVTPAAPFVTFASIADSTLDANGRGVHIGDGASATVTRTSLSSNGAFGLAVGALTRAADVMIESCTIGGNSIAGINVNGGFGAARISNSTISDNAVALQSTSGGQIFTYRTNRMDGNAGGVGLVPAILTLQ